MRLIEELEEMTDGKRMNVLVACEESQAVTIELRKLGHTAYSCDLLECSGGHEEWHIQNDVLPVLNGNCTFKTMDGKEHRIKGRWDMIIGFPPCTYLTVTGNRWFNVERYGEKAIQRYKDREFGKWFFMQIATADCDKIAIENPVGIMSTEYRKPDQIIQPWMFGDDFSKTTCLWLKGLPNLEPKKTKKPKLESVEWTNKGGKKKSMSKHMYATWSLPKEQRQRIRSKTFPGIAKAMATQWAAECAKHNGKKFDSKERISD